MLDIGWTEMFVILVVALLVIGPKDLPRTLRTMGRWMGKVRAIGRDFQRGLDEMVREAELDDIKKDIDSVKKLDLKKEVENTVDPTGSLREATRPIPLDDGAAKDSRPAEPAAGDKSTQSAEPPNQPDSPAKTGT